MFKVSRKQFEGFVREGVAAIPEKFRKKIARVVFAVEDAPDAECLREMGMTEGDDVLGLFEGPTLGEEKSLIWSLPPQITIFKLVCEEEGTSPEEVKAAVRDTVWHEVAHYLGMEEHEVLRAEERRERRAR